MFSGDMYCAKSAQIQSFFRSIFSHIPSEYRKVWTRKAPYLDIFHIVKGISDMKWVQGTLVQSFLLLLSYLLHDGGSNHIEIRPLISRANQWTGFHMIGTSVMKELLFTICCNQLMLQNFVHCYLIFFTVANRSMFSAIYFSIENRLIQT